MILVDERRDLIVPGGYEQTLKYSVEHFIKALNQGINERGQGIVALSGGSTPKAIYQMVSSPTYRDRVDWKKVYLFWSDERSVPPTNKDSNYKMAMDAGLGSLGIPSEQIYRMHAEDNLEENAERYEGAIENVLSEGLFDLMMLGMGEDGHTASLFPFTHGLQVEDKLVTPNFVPQQHTWRMTLTYPGIHRSRNICIYVLGKSKAEMVKEVLTGPFEPIKLPSQAVGTAEHKATWILDSDSSSMLNL